MIRSTGRFALDISHPDSPYFEKVICFVRPEYAENGAIDLHRAAEELIDSLDSEVEVSMTEQSNDKKLDFERGEIPEYHRQEAKAAGVAVMSIVGSLGVVLAIIGLLLIL